jgi:hypothetical protein
MEAQSSIAAYEAALRVGSSSAQRGFLSGFGTFLLATSSNTARRNTSSGLSG